MSWQGAPSACKARCSWARFAFWRPSRAGRAIPPCMSGAGPAARCDAGRAIGATGVGRTRSGGQPAAYKISLEDAAPSRGLPVAPGLMDVDGYPVIARLTIEAIGLELPVIGELSNDTL